MTGRRTTLFGLPLDVDISAVRVIDELEQRAALVSYLNPLAWKVASTDPSYLSVLEQFDLVLCDGVAVQRAVRSQTGQETEIISLDYSGLAGAYLQLWQEQRWAGCLVGGQQSVVDLATRRLQSDYPGLRVSAAFSGYEDGPQNARAHILERQPDLVLCGMGMGRQEAFLLELRDAGWRGRGIAVGGFFDKLAKPGPEYPAWALRWNLRFLARIMSDPVKFIPRYTIGYIPFMKCYIWSQLQGER